jgi:crossover junction endodeoxyribonuclease RusA
MTEIEFYVEGRPAPQGSKRAFPNGGMIEMSRYVGPWRNAVAVAAYNATRGQDPLDEPVRLRVAFYLARPKRSKFPTRPAVTPDLSKLVRATEDALTGLVWADDARVVSCLSEKFWADDREPGAFIRVATIEGEAA